MDAERDDVKIVMAQKIVDWKMKWVAPLAMCTHSPCIKIDGTKETTANGVDIV